MHTTESIPLAVPLQRGDQTITALTLRRPGSGELRGLKLMDLLNMDTVSLSVLLPRISTPTLTKADVEALDPADLLNLGIEVTNFFAPPSPTPGQG
ncbi:phage tail assembly protein [Hydrogenophaga electricum]|uniref:Tail protein n=1 Tax=Hydrogenophaga electricum TaxID=1230953 RepID=A0ABQ6BZS9_9BURK|nr:phage tail assembly protein [Hydrogenophaga electricum]GLS13616.1 tail protein [Hydrogenophaga electricum]